MRNFSMSVLLLLVQAVASSAFSQPTCSDIFLPASMRLSSLGEGFTSAFDQIRGLPMDLVNGKRTPNWNDLNQLDVLLKEIRQAKKSLDTPEKQREFEAIVAQIVRGLDQDPQLSDLATANRRHVPSGKYAPTEYELKLAYQYLLGKINRELPKGARIPTQRLPLDQRRQRINQEAREFMAEFEKSFESRIPTTGYKTFEEYEAYVRNTTDPYLRRAVELLDRGQLQVVIRRPENGRFWIPKVGLQNQYISGSSRGDYGPNNRLTAETNLYDIHHKPDYFDRDPEFMPKYGALRPSPESGVRYLDAMVSRYGEDQYVVRLSDIQDRITWTPGDSLGVGERAPKQITEWNQTFIPWKYRLLMAEFLTDALQANFIAHVTNKKENPTLSTGPFGFAAGYIEIQVLGALELKNIATFEFGKHPPSGQFLLDLLEHKIPIRDARTWPSVEWKPSEEDIRQAKESR